MNEPTPDHDELRTWAAAYVLGALEPGERSLFARHLQTCDDCRAEVASLAPIPGLLTGLGTTPGVARPVDSPTALETTPRSVLEGALRRAQATRRRERRALQLWRTAAVAAALIAVTAVVSRPSGGAEQAEPNSAGDGPTATTMVSPTTGPAPTTVVAPTTIAPDAVTLTFQPALQGSTEAGTVRLESRRWGTAVFLEASGLPARDVYTLWAVSADGRREPAASWGPTPTGRATCAGATSIAAEKLARLEIGDGEGVLATATNA